MAWAVGLFEGEGTIHLRREGGAKLELRMTDEDVVRRFCAVVGAGQVYGPVATREGWKPNFHWVSGRRQDVERILQTFIPMLGKRRLDKAAEAMAVLAARRKPGAVLRVNTNVNSHATR